MEMFVFTGIIWQEGDDFSALCPELDIATQGNSLAEAKQFLLEAATLHMEGSIEDGLPYSRPVTPSEDPRAILPESSLVVFKFMVDIAVHAYA